MSRSVNDGYLTRIARVCHEANRALCETAGDNSQVSWDEAPEWQKESAKNGVLFRINNPDAPDSAQHDAWSEDKIKDGWVFGDVKDPEKKTHPCLVDYDALPPFQREKDVVFRKIVELLK